jgi:hypothetical protein
MVKVAVNKNFSLTIVGGWFFKASKPSTAQITLIKTALCVAQCRFS